MVPTVSFTIATTSSSNSCERKRHHLTEMSHSTPHMMTGSLKDPFIFLKPVPSLVWAHFWTCTFNLQSFMDDGAVRFGSSLMRLLVSELFLSQTCQEDFLFSKLELSVRSFMDEPSAFIWDVLARLAELSFVAGWRLFQPREVKPPQIEERSAVVVLIKSVHRLCF